MAIDFFKKDEEEELQQGGIQSPQQQVGPSQGAVVEGQTAQEDGPSKSGNFTNLQSYLDANSAGQFGQQIAGKVMGEADKAKDQLAQTEQTFKSAADQGSKQADENLYSQVGQDPVAIANNQAEAERFKSLRDATYQGPNYLSDREDLYVPTAQKVQGAVESANLTGDEGGRKTLLDKYYGTGVGKYDYTSGEKKLDNLLIQNDPGARQAFDSARQNAVDTQNNFSLIDQTLANYAQQRRKETDAARMGAQGALTGAGTSLEDQLKQTLAAKQAEAATGRDIYNRASGVQRLDQMWVPEFGFNPATDLSALDAKLSDRSTGFAVMPGAPNPTAQTMLAANNINPFSAAGSTMYGVRPEDFVTYVNQEALNTSNIASPDQLARAEALAMLADQDQAWITDPNQVGQYDDESIFDVNSQGFRDSLFKNRNAYLDEANAWIPTHDYYQAQNKQPFGQGNPNYFGNFSASPKQVQEAVTRARDRYKIG